jgi:Protein of unknown function (DUF4035)
LALGKTVRQLQAEISSAEFSEWLAYNMIEPFGEERGDLRAGIIACTFAQANAKKGKRFKPEDFMPKFNKPRKTQEEMAMIAKQFAMAWNGQMEGPK